MSDPLSLLSHIVDVEALDPEGRRFTIVASPQACEALARFNDLPAVESLRAELRVAPEGRDGIRVDGTLEASIVYTCVVSLEPFASALEADIEVHFLAEDKLDAYRAAREKRLKDVAEPSEDLDEPDVIVGGKIDLGALVAEHLTLNLDPYPKKPDATFVEPSPASADPDLSPFAALSALKNNTD